MGVCLSWVRFLRRFGFSLGGSTPSVSVAESGAAPPIAPLTDTERLSRYVTTRDHFSVAKNEVHFRAFLPPNRNRELSIMRTHDLEEAGVWILGDAVAAPTNRTVYARGDFLAPDVRDSFVDSWRLSVRPDDDPPRHALIEGWPSHEVSPEIRKSLAQQLRARSTLTVRPAPSDTPA